MPLLQAGISTGGGNLPADLQNPINKILGLIDRSVAELAQKKNLSPSLVRLLRPCSFCVLVNDEFVFVVASNIHAGGIPGHIYIDWSGKPLNLQTAIYLAERDLSFERAFGFYFPRQLTTATETEKESVVHELAERYIGDEIINLERLNRIVRINPIFQGRDFMLNPSLVFVLSPFREPFNTIFIDHIKPTAEAIEGVTCLRADDIYDNKPIIEDIWRSINEAHIVLSELTDRNPNVFYETGIAHTVGKEVVLITQNMDDVPFDLRHLRCIVYEYTPRGIQILETNLRNTINNIRGRMSR
jgi:hypothetical protein